MRYFIGDTETTGVKSTDRACDIAFMEVDPGTLNPRWVCASLIDPEVPIPPEASAIHGVFDEQIVNAPTMEEFVLHRMGGRIDEPCTLIGHNIKFDVPFFKPVMEVDNTLCTLAMSREQLPTGPVNHKLGTLAAYLDLPTGTAHRALGDVMTAWHLLKYLLDASGRTLIEYLQVPVREVFYMPFGQHQGKALVDLPREYRTWLLTIDIDENLRYSLMRLREAGI